MALTNKNPFVTLAEVEIIDQNDKGINPIHFMVDYENVHQHGLKGCEYLRSCDKLTIFYSERFQNIVKKDLDKIKGSGCTFDACKLQRGGKNALDFYIAARVGEELALSNGESLTIVIVSKDRGYESVLDYCRMKNTKCIVGAECTIEEGFLKTKANNALKNYILERNSTIHLPKAEQIVKDYNNDVNNKLERAISEKDIEVDMSKVLMIKNAKYEKGSGMYYAMVKEFGMAIGREIYQLIKEIEKK